MSGDLHITFGPDMPAVAVEVVAPDLQVVERLMMTGGQTEVVPVPSEASFLRVHLPSGRTVTLTDPGNLRRTISLDALATASPRGPGLRTSSAESRAERIRRSPADLGSRREIREHHRWRAAEPPAFGPEAESLSLGANGTVRLSDPGGQPAAGRVTTPEHEAEWTVGGPPFQPPWELLITQPDQTVVAVRVPGNTQRLWVRADRIAREKTLAYSVRLVTREPVADTILNYLRRGDVGAAQSMSRWAEHSEQLLQGKMSDPYGAAIGAYLLLRLQRFEQLHDWPRNLANWVDFLPDGCVIWAWQLMQQDPTRETEIREYLLKAASRGLPVYTEGLRLLLDGLRLLGSAGAAASRELRAKAGITLWQSPLTTRVVSSAPRESASPERAISYDVGFGTVA
jgi:hypothetical protein